MVPSPRGSGVLFVTGAGGFLGGHVAKTFAEAGWTTVGFDLRAGDGWRAGPVETAALAQAAGEVGTPALIFHAAGFGSVGASLADPAGDFDAGPGSLRHTLEFMRLQAPDARLIFPSSAAVYGEAQAGAIPEDAAIAPVSPYGLHKALCERMIAGWADLFELDAVCVRFFSVYGPGLKKQLLWDIARRLAEGAEALELFGQGDEARDFLQVDDAVGVIGRIAALPAGAAPAVVNGGSGRATTVRAAAEALAAAAGFEGAVRFNGQIRPGDPRSLVADVRRAGRIGFAPQVDFERGVASFMRWAAGELSRTI